MSLRDLPVEAKRLNWLLWELNLLNAEAAQICGCSERTMYRWLAGHTKIPPSALSLLEMTLRLRERDVTV